MDIDTMKKYAVEALIRKDLVGEGDILRSFVHTKHLKVPLTQEEIISAADELAQALADIISLEEELDSIKSDFKSKLKMLEAIINEQRAKVRDKYELRKVDCVEVMSNTNGKAFELRMDTSTIIRERSLTADERQGRLWDESENDSTKPEETNEEA